MRRHEADGGARRSTGSVARLHTDPSDDVEFFSYAIDLVEHEVEFVIGVSRHVARPQTTTPLGDRWRHNRICEHARLEQGPSEPESLFHGTDENWHDRRLGGSDVKTD